MKTVTHQDPGLPSFDLDDKATVIPATDPELAIPVAASPRPIWLHGARATLLGNVRGGAREIHMDGQSVVSGLTVEAGPVANAVVSPGLLRRERISAAGSAEESVLVSPTLPMVALTYRGARPSRAALVAFPDAAQIRYRTEGSTVTVRADDKDEVLVVAAISASAGWAARPAPEGGLRLEWSGEENAAGTDDSLHGLVLAFGSATGVRTALAGARHLAGHTVRAGSPLTGELLTLCTGATALDQAVHWMEHRLAAGVRLATSERPGSEPDAWLWTGLGACAVGDTESAKACIETLDHLRRPDEAMLLASRLALATGHQNRLLDRVRQAEGLSASADHASALRGLALRTASDALRYAAPDELLADLRRSTDSGRSGASGRRLPTIGSARSSTTARPAEDHDLAEALTYLLARDTTARRRPWPSLSDERARTPLEAWTGLVAAHPDGWARWRTLVAAGLEGSDAGVGTWEALEPGRPPAITGILLSALVHGWLGVHPDAPVGRLLLAPRVPAHLTSFGVRGIRVGDASLDLDYVREGSKHFFELTPRSGRVPPMVVFEPVVYASEVTRILIDDKPAEVDVVATGEGGTSIRLQTPVDARRRVEIGTL